MKRKPVFYTLLVLFAVAIVALDQWTKRLILAADAAGKLPGKSILGIFHLMHTENTGGAWSLFEGQLWLFVLVMVLFLAALLGGGIGNMIDRLTTGSVTDMICFDFVSFPVFNVADMFITVGCAALILFVLVADGKKKPKKGESNDAAS